VASEFSPTYSINFYLWECLKRNIYAMKFNITPMPFVAFRLLLKQVGNCLDKQQSGARLGRKPLRISVISLAIQAFVQCTASPHHNKRSTTNRYSVVTVENATEDRICFLSLFLSSIKIERFKGHVMAK
jgi:hypothetical protein